MNWRGVMRIVYAASLAFVGLLFLAVMLAQIEVAKQIAKAPVLALSMMSLLWLSPRVLAVLSAWRLWSAKGAALVFWVLVSPAYVIAGFWAHQRPAWLGGTVHGEWGLALAMSGGPDKMLAAVIWLAMLILVLGGLFGVAAFFFPKATPKT